MMEESSNAMETNNGKKNYVHYNHSDPFNRFRWNVRESFQYMYGGRRPWQKVIHFYSHLLLSSSSSLNPNFPTTASSSSSRLSALFPHRCQRQHNQHQRDEEEDISINNGNVGKGRWERVTYKIVLSYHGPSFDGWQKQPHLNTVQGLVEKVLGRFIDDRKAHQLIQKSLPLEGCASVAGRTDKGVTALHQVCSFYTWRKDVKCEDIKDAINDATPGKIRAVSVSKVSRVFHPNFSAKWRRYIYIFPLDDGNQDQMEGGMVTSVDVDDDWIKEQTLYVENESFSVVCNGHEDLSSETKPRSFSVCKVNELLHQLEGKSLSYRMFARDTKASRSVGPPTECFMFHARAAEAILPCIEQNGTELKVMCVELVANRFLRKMVRVLVATAIREAAAGANDDALLKLIDASCRRATAPPAPPEGLCLVDVGYEDFEREICFIQ